MALNFPTLKEIIDRSRSDIRRVLPGLQPSLVQSFIKAIVDSNAARAFDIVNLLKQLIDQAFPQTAVGIYLARWGGYDSLAQFGPQTASGTIVAQGTVLGTPVPVSTSFASVAGAEYLTQDAAVIQAIAQMLATAVADADKIVTCTTTEAHSLATGILADFTGLTSGANTAAAFVTVIDETTFSFFAPNVTIVGSVYGVSAQYEFLGAVIAVESVESGLNKNGSEGDILALVTPIAGVNTNAFVNFNQLLGGTDGESTDDFRDRILERRANPVANFNDAAILKQVRLTPSADRVFIAKITPYPGAVTVFFFVKDTVSGLPTPAQIAEVRANILLICPVTVDPDDVFVDEPNTIPVAHQISNLVPDTESMRSAITENLKAFYEEQESLGVSITVDMIRLAIQNSQDLQLGNFPASFTLDTPVATTVVGATEIATFGSLVFV